MHSDKTLRQQYGQTFFHIHTMQSDTEVEFVQIVPIHSWRKTQLECLGHVNTRESRFVIAVLYFSLLINQLCFFVLVCYQVEV